MQKPQEYILCAAVHIDDGKEHAHQPVNIQTGFVVTGRRHHNCYAVLAAIANSVSLEETLKSIINKVNRDNQGFITSNDRFVSRKEGFKIAKDRGQIFHNLYDPNNSDQILVSEDLY